MPYTRVTSNAIRRFLELAAMHMREVLRSDY